MRKVTFATSILLALASCTAGRTDLPTQNEGPSMGMGGHHAPHIISIKSNSDFETTLAQLQSTVDQRGFKTFAMIDHAKGAASIGADLNPTTLIIFGNPKGGTPLIQAEQRLGLRLPLKMLVFEDASGGVHVAYPDMTHLFHEYGVGGLAEPRSKIESALESIAAEATQ